LSVRDASTASAADRATAIRHQRPSASADVLRPFISSLPLTTPQKNFAVAATARKSVDLSHAPSDNDRQRIRPALHRHPSCKTTRRARLGARDQTRWLPPSGPARGRCCAALHPSRLRLERSISRDRRNSDEAPRDVIHARWRGSRLRSGWDRNLRRATSPRHRQRGDESRARPCPAKPNYGSFGQFEQAIMHD
jgi:hypothetical protein